MDKSKHRFIMSCILGDIFSDKVLSSALAFKGGTAAMYFHDLPRFSTDLDFNLISSMSEKTVIDRLRNILGKYGNIDDEAVKTFGPVIVLDYGKDERKLKIEVSNRIYDNHYEQKFLAGRAIRVMTPTDMFSHKLCAFNERRSGRDIFDIWFFLSKGTPLNENIITERTGLSPKELLTQTASVALTIPSGTISAELGEVLDNKMKQFVKTSIIQDVSMKLLLLSENPILEKQPTGRHFQMLTSSPGIIPSLRKNGVDPSTVSETELQSLLDSKRTDLLTRTGRIPFVLSDGSIKRAAIFSKEGDKFVVLTGQNEKLLYDGISSPKDGFYVVKNNGKFNYMSETGDLLAENALDAAEMFEGGTASCKIGKTLYKINNKGVIIEKNNIAQNNGKKI